MSKRIVFLIVLLCVQLYNVKSGNAFYSEAIIFNQQDDSFFLHTVERGQTVYSISVLYKVTVESIYKLNPESRDGIKEGSVLKIPQVSGSYYYHTIQPKETLYSVSKKYQMTGEDIIAANPGLSVPTFTIGKTIRIPTNQVTASMASGNETEQKHETEALLNQQPKGDKLNTLKVALLLPFGLKEGTNPMNASSNRFVEYYGGFLMALQQMKNNGISVDLQVYDIGNDESSLPGILKKASMQDVNLLIGGLSDKQIKMISSFSKEKEIPYVIPFTSKSDEPLNNSHVFQINTPQSYLYSKVSSFFCKMHKDDNIIFYISDSSNEKMEFVQTVQSDLNQSKKKFVTFKPGDDFLKDIQPLLSSQKKNIIVPSDDSQEALVKMIAPLKSLSDSHPEYATSLFGYPSWQVYASDYMEDYFKLSIGFYSVFYVDQTSPEVKFFYMNFTRWYSHDLINTFPKFGILGYDTGMFFMKGLNEFGSSFEANVKKVKYDGIQTDFQFDRINNWSGFINTNIYIITFNPNLKVSKDICK